MTLRTLACLPTEDISAPFVEATVNVMTDRHIVRDMSKNLQKLMLNVVKISDWTYHLAVLGVLSGVVIILSNFVIAIQHCLIHVDM